MKKTKNGVSYANESYFEENPTIPSKIQSIKYKIKGESTVILTDRGIFSNEKLDSGTKVLLKIIPDIEIEGDILDLGAGYGPISIFLAKKYPEKKIYAIDVNQRAINMLRQNAENLSLRNIIVSKSEDLDKNIKFAAIISNPPIRIGKEKSQLLLLTWLSRLNTNGEAYLVIKRNLGADSIAKFLSENNFPTSRFASKNGYRILKVSRTN